MCPLSRDFNPKNKAREGEPSSQRSIYAKGKNISLVFRQEEEEMDSALFLSHRQHHELVGYYQQCIFRTYNLKAFSKDFMYFLNIFYLTVCVRVYVHICVCAGTHATGVPWHACGCHSKSHGKNSTLSICPTRGSVESNAGWILGLAANALSCSVKPSPNILKSLELRRRPSFPLLSYAVQLPSTVRRAQSIFTSCRKTVYFQL